MSEIVEVKGRRVWDSRGRPTVEAELRLGCGAVGGNITSDNIGPQHLMNIKRIAWEASSVPLASPAPAPAAAGASCACQHAQPPAAASSELEQTIERILAERGIRPQAPTPTPAPAVVAAT